MGILRTDKNGLGYWKFREFGEVPSEPTPAPKPTTPAGPSLDLPAALTPSVEQLEEVKKFREKYGQPNSETQ